MAARTGAEYMKGLQAQEREVWLRGERVKDVTKALPRQEISPRLHRSFAAE